jgi:hypothetical protein
MANATRFQRRRQRGQECPRYISLPHAALWSTDPRGLALNTGLLKTLTHRGLHRK